MEVQETNPFELQRQQLIARNRARLLALGIPEAVSGLSKLAPKKAAAAAAAAAKRKQPKPQKAEPAAPSRQSNRLRDQALIARGEVPPDVEPGSELAVFVIDGECPRCGKVLSSGHGRHLQSCKGPREPPTEEEVAAQAEAYKSQQKEKLRQLELGGLVDFSTGSSSSASSLQAQQQEAAAAAAEEPPKKRQRGEGAVATAAAAAAGESGAAGADETQQQQQQQQAGKGKKAAQGKKGKAAGAAAAPADTAAAAAAAGGGGGGEAFATFIVIGSTGNHYVVRLTDAKRSCTCMDHRIRRRDCKHIRLIWEQLGIADNPAAWQQAVARKVSELAAADESDVAMVHQAEARKAARQQKAAAAAAAKA